MVTERQNFAEPVTILSDVHLGHPASFVSDPRQLLPLVEGSGTVVFNGDSCELLNRGRRDKARSRLANLADLLVSRNIRPLFIAGNHDPLISSQQFLHLYQDKVFVTHGDALHPIVAPWSQEAPTMRVERARLLASSDRSSSANDNRFVLAKEVALVAAIYDVEVPSGFIARLELFARLLRHPVRVMRLFHYWANVVRRCKNLQLAHAPEAEYFVLGHTHRAGIWKREGLTVINTGSYMPLSQTLTVRIGEGRLTVYQVRRQGEEYRLGKIRASWTLPVLTGNDPHCCEQSHSTIASDE